MATAQPQTNTTSGAPARLCALGALVHTLDKGKPLDTAWTEDRYFADLSPSDRAFAQLLVKTTLRHLGQIDALMTQFMERPLTGKTTRILHCLRLGVTQLLFLHTPPHAAVHSAVEMTKQLRLEKFSGLVNAVLKRVSREGAEILSGQDAARLNTPDWLWNRWSKNYGEHTARAIATAHLQDPPTDITVKSDGEKWAAELGGTLLAAGSVRLLDAKQITKLSGFESGAWWVQDVAATLPAKLMGNVSGKRIIDLCAAPGGKTAQLAAAGANVSAVDVSRERIALMRTNVSRLKLTADFVTSNAVAWTPTFTPDAILLDAPCSATGTLRRHPDVARHRSEADITRLAAQQTKLLHHALDLLREGGLLVYATCSLEPEEGEQQITRLLAARSDVKLVPVEAHEIGGLSECITKDGMLRTLPSFLHEQGGMDGFFAAKLIKL